MILIITHKQDYTADYIIDKLNKRKIAYYRFNCEDCLESNITLRFGKQQDIAINNFSIFTAVWYRRTKLPEIKDATVEEKIYLANEIDSFLHNMFGVIKAKWLSEPASVVIAENKFLQLSIAKEIGFNVPTTIITTNKNELIAFTKKYNKTIIKPISRGRIDYKNNESSKLIFTSILDKDTIAQIDYFHLTPAICQEYIEKEYEIRVTIVGEDIYASRVDSQTDEETIVDWRKKKLKFKECFLPEDINQKCLQLLSRLNLSYGAFDLVKSLDNRYYFLEINPNGQWVWIEKDTEQKISDSIINFLTC